MKLQSVVSGEFLLLSFVEGVFVFLVFLGPAGFSPDLFFKEKIYVARRIFLMSLQTA